MYYDKRNKKLYVTRTKLAEAHPALSTLNTATEAHAYFFEQDIEVLTVITPSDVNLDIYTLVPGPIDIENNTLTMVSQLRQDLSMEDIFKQRWSAAKDNLDTLYRQTIYEVPPVELVSWPTQEKEANLVLAANQDAALAEVEALAPLLTGMVQYRAIPGETVRDLAALVLLAVQRLSAVGASLIGQWQRIDKALRAATTIEELLAIDIVIVAPVTQ